MPGMEVPHLEWGFNEISDDSPEMEYANGLYLDQGMAIDVSLILSCAFYSTKDRDRLCNTKESAEWGGGCVRSEQYLWLVR